MRQHCRLIRTAATVLLAAVLAAAWPASAQASAAQVEIDPTIRVGLFYGKNALPTANLENSVGSGYFLGYYDSGMEFQPLWETGQRKITMCAADASPGRYHTQVDTPYFDAASAGAAAEACGGYVCFSGGAYWVRGGAYPTYEDAASAAWADMTVAEDSADTVTVTVTGSSQVLFQFDGGRQDSFAVLPDGRGEQASTWFKGNKYYGGFQYRTEGGSALSVINVLGLEDYIKGVITVEMSPSWPAEALKAQAVCARNYAYRRLLSSTHTSQGFDICNTVHCQAYSGMKSATDSSNAAVEATYGEYVWYQNTLAETNYYSSNGGGSENSENVWTSAVPHLRGKMDPYEALVEDRITSYHWTVRYTRQELSDLMNRSGYTNGGNVSVRVSKTSETGNVIEIVLSDLDSGRTWTKRKEDVRTFFGLRSMRYTILTDGAGSGALNINGAPAEGGTLYAVNGSGAVSAISGTPYIITADGVEPLGGGGGQAASAQAFTFSGSGWGHHVGMSQWGAYSMAQEGYTYQEILNFYYTGIEIDTP